MHDQIKGIVDAARRIVIIQADNPDGDSLASSLALEQILHDLDKDPVMYCAIDMPEYLKYLSGWDRVGKEIPNDIEAVIIVDTSSLTLLGNLEASDNRGRVAGKPVIVLDHHKGVECDIPYATAVLNDDTKVSTGELIYDIAKRNGWPLNLAGGEFIMTSILSDSLGLATEATTPGTYRVMAELVESGVSRPKLEELRRDYSKMPEIIFRYKAELIRRTEFHFDGRLAIVTVPQDEISTYSPLYNPNALVQNEHLQTKGVLVSVVMKSYSSGRITAGIRCSTKAPVASRLAEKFGGGGHEYSAGFKLEGKPLESTKADCIEFTGELLQTIPENTDEVIQHTF